MLRIIKADPSLRVRLSPVDGLIVGGISKGSAVEAEDLGKGWSRIDISAGGVKIESGGYISNEWLEPIDTPVPIPPIHEKRSMINVGLNTLYSTEHATEALDLGCNIILTINNVAGAAELKRKYPKAEIIVRKIFEKGFRPDLDFALKELGVNGNNPPLNYVLLNENDHDDFNKDMKARSELDIAFARKMKEKAPNARFLAYMYAPACNEDSENRWKEDVKKYYAPHFNSGLIDVDHHPYELSLSNLWDVKANGRQYFWWATRYRFLFQCCGFNFRPNSVWASEAGVDQGSIGGFNTLNPTQDYFNKWMDEYTRLLEEPFMVNGHLMESPVKGICIYQYREKNSPSGKGWEGYSVEKYFDWFKKRWTYENQS